MGLWEDTLARISALESLTADHEARITKLESGNTEPPEPVDCILGEEVLASEEFGECVGGKQIVERIYIKPILVNPANGGAECGERVRVETFVRDCETEPPPDLTFPPIEPVLPLVSFPEKRSYKSAQWHIDMDRQMDINSMQHTHSEAWIPERVRTGIFQVDINTILYHMQGCTYLGIRKAVMRFNGGKKWIHTYPGEKEPGRRSILIPEGDAGHEVRFVEPIVYDVRGVLSGYYRFEVDLSVRRRDNKLSHTRIHFNIYIDNEGNHDLPLTRAAHGEGWESPMDNDTVQTGYTIIHATYLPEYVSDPIKPISIKIDAPAGEPVEFLVCKNPNLHLHPPDYGEIIHKLNFLAFGVIKHPDGTQTEVGDKRFWKFQIPAIPGLVAGDRIMMRIVNSSQPELGAFATLIVNKIAEG